MRSIATFRTDAQPGKKPALRRKPDPNSVCAGAGYGVFGVGYTLGVEYQRILGKKGLISVLLPVSWSQSRVSTTRSYGQHFRNDFNVLFAAPGILYHPGGAYEAVDFSIGVQLAIGDLSLRATNYWGGPLSQSSIFIAPLAAMNIAFRSRRSNSIFGLHIAVGPTLEGDFGLPGRSGENGNPVFFEGGIRFGGYC